MESSTDTTSYAANCSAVQPLVRCLLSRAVRYQGGVCKKYASSSEARGAALGEVPELLAPRPPPSLTGRRQTCNHPTLICVLYRPTAVVSVKQTCFLEVAR